MEIVLLFVFYEGVTFPYTRVVGVFIETEMIPFDC